jgi:hypothetical protein
MLATTHYATTNSDGTITTQSTSVGMLEGKSVMLPVWTSTHNADMFALIFGKSRTNDVVIVTVILDNVLLIDD